MTPLVPGTRIAGRYAVLRALGEGGMGQVFEVQHLSLGRRFALKLLRPNLVNAVLVRRFEREAQALGRLASARVAQVTDFGIDPGFGPFYVMELLDGETLGDRLDREGRLSVPESAELAIEIAEALAEVHAAALVHRDLKPSNVGLPFKGPVKAKLLDFGLAAVLDGEMPRLTKSQELLGSLPYMAPEQFIGDPPTPAIDVYALGVVTYEMLTGRLPFDAESSAALMHQILTRPVPPIDDERLGLAVPAPLAAVVMRLLAREPGARYASAELAAQALRAAAVGPSRERTLPANEEAAMPGTRATPAVPTTTDPYAATAESPSMPPEAPRAAGQSDTMADAATLLVAAATPSDVMPAADPGETWRSGPPGGMAAAPPASGPTDAVAASLAAARAERRVPSTSEVPAAIRTTSAAVAGLRSGRRVVVWAGVVAAAAIVAAMILWLTRAPAPGPIMTGSSPALATPAPSSGDSAASPAAAAALPVGEPPPASASTPALPEPATPVATPAIAPDPATRTPRTTKRTGTRGSRPDPGDAWTGEIIEAPR